MDERMLALARERYVSLTTFRRDGRPVATPVWFALDGSRILVRTEAASGKVKRLRANGRASIAACDMRGRITGPAVAARGRVLPAGEFARADRALSAKYRYQKPLVEFWGKLRVRLWRRPRRDAVFVELQLSDDTGAGGLMRSGLRAHANAGRTRLTTS